jgi:excinuclease ABC subunit C
MDTHSKKIADLPHHAGVYIYKDKYKKIIYVGKAIDIQKRVKQYFQKKAQLSTKTKQLVETISDIDHITTISEFDAILLEAKLISTHKPKYNVVAKDDKSPIYISIPIHDSLPIISLVRKTQATTSPRHTALIGPFQSTHVAKQILSLIRTVIPYCRQKIRKGKPCFYTHLGLCNPCPSAIMAMSSPQQKEKVKVYRKNIYLLKNLLEGKSIATRKHLEQIMHLHALKHNFEKAAYVRNQIQHLDNLLQTHFDPYMYTTTSKDIEEVIDNQLNDVVQILKPYYPSIHTPNRIECIDISQLAGTNPVGSLVVLDHGIVNTSLYRRFSIHSVVGQNDTKMIEEVITRRLHHPEWPFPDLFVIDGGKAQVKAAHKALLSNALSIPIIGIAKRFEHIIVYTKGAYTELLLSGTRPAVHIIQRIRDESHRFAHRYHVIKRKKAYLTKI